MSARQLGSLELNETFKHEDTVGSLAASLGFDRLEDDALFAPYIAYVQAHWPGKGTKADFMRLFIDLVLYFRGAPFRPCDVKSGSLHISRCCESNHPVLH